MNKRQLQVAKSLLNSEQQVIKSIEQSYKDALADINKYLAELYARTDNLQSVIYQIKWQKALKTELETLLNQLHKKNYTSIDDYLKDCYNNGHIGTLFNMQGEGIPLILPLNQEQIVSAVTLNSKLSAPLYNALGYDIDLLKIDVAREISRGIAQGISYQEVARNLKNITGIGYNKALRIAKTEGHRIQNEAAYNVMREATKKGADVVKEWDSTLDGKTRPTHRALDGTIIPIDAYFKTESGYTSLYPGEFGVASEDCNCRCAVLERASWALSDEEFTKMNGVTNELQHFESIADYNEFKKEFWKVGGGK